MFMLNARVSDLQRLLSQFPEQIASIGDLSLRYSETRLTAA